MYIPLKGSSSMLHVLILHTNCACLEEGLAKDVNVSKVWSKRLTATVPVFHAPLVGDL